jgi:hypothetical protein
VIWGYGWIRLLANDHPRTATIALTIERYLSVRPRAADTVEGVRLWVASQGYDEPLSRIEAALDHLVRRNRLVRIVRADGTVIYSRDTRSTSNHQG